MIVWQEVMKLQKYIITISREFGCGAREIARGLASELAIVFHDKDLVDYTVEKAGVHARLINEYDEKIPKDQKKLWKEFGYGSSDAFYSDDAIDAQTRVIKEIADKEESSILFGRCSNYILKEYANVLHFFLYASYEYRIKHIMGAYHLSEKDAAKMIKRIDKQRSNYYEYVTGKNRNNSDGNNLMIDVNRFGVDGSIKMMKEAVKVIFGE